MLSKAIFDFSLLGLSTLSCQAGTPNYVAPEAWWARLAIMSKFSRLGHHSQIQSQILGFLHQLYHSSFLGVPTDTHVSGNHGPPNDRQTNIQKNVTSPRRPRASGKPQFISGPNMGMEPWNYIFCTVFLVFSQ